MLILLLTLAIAVTLVVLGMLLGEQREAERDWHARRAAENAALTSSAVEVLASAA